MPDDAPGGPESGLDHNTSEWDKKARFEDLLEFPNAYTFRVVCAALPRAEADTTACLERLTGQPARVVSTKPSRTGKWTVLRVQVEVASADQIRHAYTLLDALDGVRMVL